MKYSGVYWNLLHKSFENVLTQKYDRAFARNLLKDAKRNNKKFILDFPDIGADNPLKDMFYLGCIFISIWKTADGVISVDSMKTIVISVLEKFRGLFGLVNLNKKWAKNRLYSEGEKFLAWQERNTGKYQLEWKAKIEQKEKGYAYTFLRCPFHEFCTQQGYAEILPVLCSMDFLLIEMMHGKLYREFTCGTGDYCDFWICGDKE